MQIRIRTSEDAERKNLLALKCLLALCWIIIIACAGSTSELSEDAATATETPTGSDEINNLAMGQKECTILSDMYPQAMDLPPVGDNGAYDPTLAMDPETGRLWMVFSRVTGQIGHGQVSTHLAYSDDDGKQWCYAGVINLSTKLAPQERPEMFSDAASAHWNHEVPSIAYDPAAPADERWRLLWHRYLHVDDGNRNTGPRKFIFGWIASRTASDPSLLADAEETGLFSAAGYFISPAIEKYNDQIVGASPIKLHLQHSTLANCAAFTEPGMQDFEGSLYVSLVCGREDGQNPVILVKLDHEQDTWSYVSTILTAADAQNLDPQWKSFTATDLYIDDDKEYIIVSPVSTKNNLYMGCVIFQIDLTTGTVVRKENALPQILLSLPQTEGALQTGVCTYHPESVNTGIIIGDAVRDTPQFRLHATGIIP